MRRRQLLAGAAALPFAGIASAGKGANLHISGDDPAVRAFHVWRVAWQAWIDFFRGRDDWDDDDPEENSLHRAEWEARTALAEAVATTPAGLLGQLVLALDTFGDMNVGGDLGNPDAYSFGAWKDDIDGKLLTSMLTGAQRLA